MLGVGTGENLNEHILGTVGRQLAGAARDAGRGDPGHPKPLGRRLLEPSRTALHRRERRVLTRSPSSAPPIFVAAGGKRRPSLPARAGDGLVSTAPDRDLIKAFERAGGRASRATAELTVCWAADEAEARRPRSNTGRRPLGGELSRTAAAASLRAGGRRRFAKRMSLSGPVRSGPGAATAPRSRSTLDAGFATWPSTRSGRSGGLHTASTRRSAEVPLPRASFSQLEGSM